MLYALLAYHEEHVIQAMSEADDRRLMGELERAHARINEAGRLGPAARLGATAAAVTVRGSQLVIDGPFAETKEQLLGFYVIDVADLEAAVAAARSLKAANPSAVYEIRPIVLFRPGQPIELTEAGLELVRP
jgi:hypothetical protein